ncbi:MAG: hypothetical protein JWR61_677 [Ferruginibacter sp.]|nr:hypothetical protein [Ferruginibacter sp.]
MKKTPRSEPAKNALQRVKCMALKIEAIYKVINYKMVYKLLYRQG